LIPPGELDEPMTFAVAQDGRVFVNERRTGNIKVYDPSTGLTQRVGTIPINHQYTNAAGVPREAEEGFVGLTLDPGFAENGWAYILFAHPEAAKHTLARIEIRDQIVDGTPQTRIVPESYRVLLEYPVQREVCCHTGGGNDRVLPAKDPSRPTNTSVNNTGLRELPPAQPAMIYYPSGVSPSRWT
jgi:cytochrome c